MFVYNFLETGAPRPILWVGSLRQDLRRFPAAVRRLFGLELRRLQLGLDPRDWKPMPRVGLGVREIRVHLDGACRVFYVTARPEGIYVLHAFQKKTRKTGAAELRLGQQRYRVVQNLRTQQ